MKIFPGDLVHDDANRKPINLGAEVFNDNLIDSLDMVASKRRSFGFDLLSWRQNGYADETARTNGDGRFEYEFYLSDRQRMVLDRQLSQFRSRNIGLTLRKISEEIGADVFFYRVRRIAPQAPTPTRGTAPSPRVSATTWPAAPTGPITSSPWVSDVTWL